MQVLALWSKARGREPDVLWLRRPVIEACTRRNPFSGQKLTLGLAVEMASYGGLTREIDPLTLDVEKRHSRSRER